MPSTPTTRKPITTLDIAALSPTQFSRSPRVNPSTPLSSSSSSASSGAVSSPKVQQVHSRLTAIIRRLVENYSTWQLGHEKGTRFCTQLENIKLKLLDKAKSTEDDTTTGAGAMDKDSSVFSDDLSNWHQRLQVVMEVFVDIVKNASEAVNQLRALEQLHRMNTTTTTGTPKGTTSSCPSTLVIGRTWPLSRFVEASEMLLTQFQRELQVKERVFREICHRTSAQEVILTSSAWAYPRHVNKETTGFIVKCLTTECGLPDAVAPGDS